MPLLRARMVRVSPRHRTHYRSQERFDILWHAERYKLSAEKTAALFVVAVGTIMNWRRALRDEPTRLLQTKPPANKLPDFIRDLARRLRAEWPGWGTRRIAGILLRLGYQVSRTSVQAFLRLPKRSPKEARVPVRAGHVVAKHPGHVWFVDFTRVGNALRSVFVGAVIDGYSRKVLSIGVWPKEPPAYFATRLLRQAIAVHGEAPRWVVTDHGTQFTAKLFVHFLQRTGILRRFGRVHRHGSLAVIERFWKAWKLEHAGRLLLYRPLRAIERQIRSYATWFCEHRPHQGLGQRTPDEVHRGLRTAASLLPLRGILQATLVGGARDLPVLTLRDAA